MLKAAALAVALLATVGSAAGHQASAASTTAARASGDLIVCNASGSVQYTGTGGQGFTYVGPAITAVETSNDIKLGTKATPGVPCISTIPGIVSGTATISAVKSGTCLEVSATGEINVKWFDANDVLVGTSRIEGGAVGPLFATTMVVGYVRSGLFSDNQAKAENVDFDETQPGSAEAACLTTQGVTQQKGVAVASIYPPV